MVSGTTPRIIHSNAMLLNTMRSSCRNALLPQTRNAAGLYRTIRPRFAIAGGSFHGKRSFQSYLFNRQDSKPLSRKPIGGSEPRFGSGPRNSTVEFSAGGALVLLVLVGGGLYYFFEKEKKKQAQKKLEQATQSYGKPDLGGPFELVDQDNKPFTDQDLKGKYSLVYFGFTNCPDICPDELDKLGVWLKELKEKYNFEPQPIFITCDPARDSPEVIKEYLTDFYPGIIGLTGTYEQVKRACKQYRVYFSTPPDVKPGQDYLVDHSVFFYFMDPDGEFIDALGLNYDETTGVEKILKLVEENEGKH